MADLFVCIEDVPMYSIMKMFYYLSCGFWTGEIYKVSEF